MPAPATQRMGQKGQAVLLPIGKETHLAEKIFFEMAFDDSIPANRKKRPSHRLRIRFIFRPTDVFQDPPFIMRGIPVKVKMLLPIALLAFALNAQALPIPTPPRFNANSYVLMDANSGQIIAANHPDKASEPASLTKLMTTYVVFHALQDGMIKLGDTATISEKAWRMGGSRTFLKLGSKVTINELLHGMITQSGNDATVALAERVAGTEATFVELMNRYARKLGMKDSHFVDASGLTADPRHHTTARDLAILSRAIIDEFPQYQHYFEEKYYSWNNIRQPNRNRLLFTDPTVDGLKTGHTDKAGYCLIASANRKHLRLIAVVMGAKSESARARYAEALLNYGSTFFEGRSLYAADAPITRVPVWKGAEDAVPVGSFNALYVTLPKADAKDLRTVVQAPSELVAPVAKNTRVGTLNVMAGDSTLARVPLYTLNGVPRGNIFRRAIDTVRLWFK